MWVYHAEKPAQDNPHQGYHFDFPFAPHYKPAATYTQRLRLNLRVPQPEGVTLPPWSRDPHTNAMYKSLLYRPFRQERMDDETGETPDCFKNLMRDASADCNPLNAVAVQWQRYWAETIETTAETVRKTKCKTRIQAQSLWETQEIFVKAMRMSQCGPFGNPNIAPEEAMTRVQNDDWELETKKELQLESVPGPASVEARLTIKEYACQIAYQSARNWEGVALACVAPKVRRNQLASDSVEDPHLQRLRTAHAGGDFDDTEDGYWENAELRDIVGDDLPERPADELSDQRWQQAWQFHRQCNAPFVKYMCTWGVLRELNAANTLPYRLPSQLGLLNGEPDWTARRLKSTACPSSPPEQIFNNE